MLDDGRATTLVAAQTAATVNASIVAPATHHGLTPPGNANPCRGAANAA